MQTVTQTPNYRVEADFENLIAQMFHGRAKKPSWRYRFRNTEHMQSYINKAVENAEAVLKSRAERKAQIKANAEELRAAVKVGSIFCYSWGYEQTNINFYQVIEIKGKSTLIIREIAKESVKQTGWASDEVVPAVNQFVGAPETVRLNQFGGINRGHGSASLTEPKQKHHRSWYA